MFGCSRITRPAYQAWSTWPLIIHTQANGQGPFACIAHIGSVIGVEGQIAPTYLGQYLYLTQLSCLVASYPVGYFGGNQLLGGSMSLSPLCEVVTSNLHVSIATIFHR